MYDVNKKDLRGRPKGQAHEGRILLRGHTKSGSITGHLNLLHCLLHARPGQKK